MGIEWIERTAADLAERDLRQLVDVERAVDIARSEALGIQTPQARIDGFVRALPDVFAWFAEAHRSFPWRRTRDPWAVITAEILLQRTHAATVADVYPRFSERFPDAAAIHHADRETVFEMVEPLGFGNRKTRTLRELARAVVTEHGGSVPTDVETLQALPRVGPYTARACLCFAGGQALALVDTNVATVVEDTLGYESSRRAHKDTALYELLDALIPGEPDPARVFNLALLDLPTLVCEQDPATRSCPFAAGCHRDDGGHS